MGVFIAIGHAHKYLSACADPERPKCIITGLPARYRDPLTGYPYASLQAFKTLRERCVLLTLVMQLF
jgi:hypothetical protein